jgi:hypothetical protein
MTRILIRPLQVQLLKAAQERVDRAKLDQLILLSGILAGHNVGSFGNVRVEGDVLEFDEPGE